MQIAYSHLFCVVLLLCIVRNAAQVCDSNSNTSTKFQSNLNMLLNNLVNNIASSNGFNISAYGQNPDRVYGLVQCFGSATVEECFKCSQEIANLTRQKCRNATGANLLRDMCFIRYDNYSFFGKLDIETTSIYSAVEITYKPDVFRTTVTDLFKNLSDGALQSPIRYSSIYTVTSTNYPLHGLVRCFRDLTSVDDCKKCLTNAISTLLSLTFGGNKTLIGGSTWSGSCFARYEPSRFFNPAPQQPLLSLPTAKKSPNKIGIVLGVAGGLLAMLLFCLYAVRRKFKSARLWMAAHLRRANLDIEIDQKHVILFNLENIKTATRSFHEDNKLGEGGFGSVYKGTMPNGVQIAVKKLSVQSLQGKEQFLNEVKLVAKIQHRNLVKLLGCCAEGSERLLVYELLANKSLDKMLFHPQRSKELDWPKRLNIILGVARGLLYLHQDSHLRIIHRDIKTSNILLDEKLEPKISDFGLARLIHQDESHVETRLVGTFGYMAPEYVMLGQLSSKVDVYSFGVVILEIICGRKNIDKRLSQEFQSLIEWVWRSYKRGNIMDVIDKEMIESFSSEQVLRCIHVGLLCTQEDALVRPPMTSVHAMLLNSSAIQNPTNPAYINVVEEDVSLPISTSTYRTTIITSTDSSPTRVIYPSINNVTITDLDSR
ncbi:hypothetical protein SUGI_1179480 [Cryptomeria japonica]|uniref:cysteine-rich receptor-like protein kinase 44 n=1 Tax=Cryptomeria japonica TaxID=3369 RepID=UPI002414AF45|nr:cysteine-rich receptor-like protein kinase 44 [Cryptomeria japonica]GLJ54940.1 hypothetical protein SUGI_1179480 [Cryptomeria japonica]